MNHYSRDHKAEDGEYWIETWLRKTYEKEIAYDPEYPKGISAHSTYDSPETYYGTFKKR